MKIAYASDLHLEFESIQIKNTENADILILGGDICVAEHFNRMDPSKTDKKSKKLANLALGYIDFFKNTSEEFQTVLYVLGNHEHYSSDISDSKNIIEKNLKKFSNIHILENEEYQVTSNISILACTLWTNMNNFDALTTFTAQQGLNDFKLIKNDSVAIQVYPHNQRYFHPEDSAYIFNKSLEYLDTKIKDNSDKEIIIVTHHAPSKESTLLQYQDSLLNYCYYSDLAAWIHDKDNLKFWIHGHCHNKSNYNINNCNILANPRGYAGYEESARNFKLKYIDLQI